MRDILKHRLDDNLGDILEETQSGWEFKLMDFEINFYLFWIHSVTQRRLTYCMKMATGN